LMQKQAQIITDELAKVDSQNQSFYQQNLKTLQEKILSLDQDYSKGLKVCQQSTIFTSHEAFSYLAKRYNFKVESISGISPDQEPTSQDLARLTALVKNLRAKYILTESLVDTKLADTLAKETGVKTLVLNPIEGLTQEQDQNGQDYFSLMGDNLKVLKTALGCI